MIEKVDPKIVVPLGTAALQALKFEPVARLLRRKASRLVWPGAIPSRNFLVSRNTAQQIEDYQALRKLLDDRNRCQTEYFGSTPLLGLAPVHGDAGSCVPD